LGFVEVVPESKDVIEFLTVVDNDKLIICRLQDVKHAVNVYSLLTGELIGPLFVPMGSIISSLTGRKLVLS
jgi:prolyl oligopeptidase PreP (S9A serine peptidase family)